MVPVRKILQALRRLEGTKVCSKWLFKENQEDAGPHHPHHHHCLATHTHQGKKTVVDSKSLQTLNQAPP